MTQPPSDPQGGGAGDTGDGHSPDLTGPDGRRGDGPGSPGGPGQVGAAAVGDQGAPARGADLARNALEAARARNAAARAARTGRRTAGGARSGGGSVAARMGRRRWSGPGPDKRRDPQLLGDTVRSWLSSTGSGGNLARAAVFARWVELVGPEIADHCTPTSLVDGELVLTAESTAWATQLRMLAPQLAQRINAVIGRGTVARIRAKGPTGPSWRFGNRHVPGRGPRDTYG